MTFFWGGLFRRLVFPYLLIKRGFYSFHRNQNPNPTLFCVTLSSISTVFTLATPPTTSTYALDRTPNFQKLKFAADSNEVDDCLHLAFRQDYTENDALLMVLGEKRDELQAKVKWLEDLVKEGGLFLPLHDNGDIGLDRLKETLKRERKVLAGLIKVMDLARKGREEKKINLFWFE